MTRAWDDVQNDISATVTQDQIEAMSRDAPPKVDDDPERGAPPVQPGRYRPEPMNAARVIPIRPAPTLVPESASSTSYIDWADFWARDHSAEDWLYEDILARAKGHSIVAKAGTGKSLLSLYICLKLIESGNLVLLLDYEMTEGDLHERLTDMGADPDTDLSLLRYYLLPSLPPLDTTDGGAELHRLVDRAGDDHPDRHVVVIVDTISRAVQGMENDNNTIQDFYRHSALGLKQRDVTWARLDHLGKDPSRGARGGSAKWDDVDLEWIMESTDDGLKLTRAKTRITWAPEVVNLKAIREPVLRYEQVIKSWPAGTQEVADLLDELRVPPDASGRKAMEALQTAGEGKRKLVVDAAQRWRRMIASERTAGRDAA